MTGSNVQSLEQLSLETAFEWRQRWTWYDMWRKAVPCLSRRHKKCTTAECLPLKARDEETGRRSRPKMPSWLDLRHTDEFVGEVARPQSMEASIGQHRQFVLDLLRKSQPVQITEERCHVPGSTSSVDQPGNRVEHGPQPVRQAIRNAGECSIAVVKARQHQWHDKRHEDWPRIRRTNAAESAQHGEAAGHHLRDISLHADVAVQINPEVSDWSRRRDDIVPDTQTGRRKLMLTSNGCAPEHFRLDCVQLKTIRLHLFCNVINASRNLLLQLQGIRWRWVAAYLCVVSMEMRNEVMPFDEPQ